MTFGYILDFLASHDLIPILEIPRTKNMPLIRLEFSCSRYKPVILIHGSNFRDMKNMPGIAVPFPRIRTTTRSRPRRGTTFLFLVGQ